MSCSGGKVWVFYAEPKSKMVTTAGHRLTLDPMGKCSNAFFSESTNMIKSENHPMNIHVQFSFDHICSFWEEGIWIFSHRVQYKYDQKLNCTWMFIGWSSINFRFFVPVWNSKWQLQQDLVMIIPGQFGFNCPSGFREEAFWTFFP
jgi:hypothetical protein